MTSHHPVILSMKLKRDLFVSQFYPIDRNIDSWQKMNDYQKMNPLPRVVEKCTTYSPYGLLMLSDTEMQPHQGWRLQSSQIWSKAPKRQRDLLMKNALNRHIKAKSDVLKIGNDWSYIREEVKESNGGVATIHHCLAAKYVQVGEIDGLAYDFVRKVRSGLSIDEELKMNIFPHGEDDWKEVMVTVNSGDQEYSGGYLKKIDESSNLNMKFDGSKDTIREYDATKGIHYSDEQAMNTCIIHVKQGRNVWPYAGSRVFRVLRIEDWAGSLKGSMKKLLRLTPKQFETHVNKGIRLLRGFKFGGEVIDFEFNTTLKWNVQSAGVSNLSFLTGSESKSKLLWNGSWRHHLKNHQQTSSEPLPDLNLTYCVHENDLWALNDLKSYTESVTSLVPGWKCSPSEKTLILKGQSQTAMKQSIRNELSKLDSLKGSHLVVSALRPSRPGMNVYTWLKRALTEKRYTHQNYLINAHEKLSAPNKPATHEVNLCQLLLKFGRLPVPFAIELGEVDMTIGVDIGRSGTNKSRPAMAVAIDKFGCMWGGSVSSEPQPGEEMSDRTVRDLFDNQIHSYRNRTSEYPKRVLVLRDGNSSKKELESVRVVSHELQELGIDVAWVTLQKSGTPRLLSYNSTEVLDQLPPSESFLITSNNTGWCWTTGGPAGRFPGIPRGFSFRVEQNFVNEPLNMEEVSKILIAQAKTSQVNPYSNTRLPFTLHLADKMAKALIRGAIPPDYSGDGFPAC
jgi:hypothetical protein